MRIQGQYINVNGGQLITESIEVRYKVEPDKVLIKYYLDIDSEPLRLYVETEIVAMAYNEFGEEMGIMPIKTRKYFPGVLFGTFEDIEAEILNKIKEIEEFQELN